MNDVLSQQHRHSQKNVTLSEKTEMLKDECVFSKEINNLKL